MADYRKVIESIQNDENLSRMTVPIPIGTDKNGNLFVEDLQNVGNIFIAGMKGSGKTTFLNQLITVLIKTKTPQELRLLIVNRTEEETKIYRNIPHLGMPPISDPSMTGQVINYLRDEMERRYVYFARENVKDITKYNDRMIREGNEEKVLPYYVLIIEEAMNMIQASENQSGTMNDLAALSLKAKYAGINFIVATNRVSQDIISNPATLTFFPNRIVFKMPESSLSGDERIQAIDGWTKGHLYYFKHLSPISPIKLDLIEISPEETVMEVENASSEYSDSALLKYAKEKAAAPSGDFRQKYLWLVEEKNRLLKDNKALMSELGKKQKELTDLKERIRSLLD
ncbi:MAG: hypothetical protein IJ831_04480 [Spirochaetales bacterium]|nr:hypothetical protein [Spirochaetales bacterium]